MGKWEKYDHTDMKQANKHTKKKLLAQTRGGGVIREGFLEEEHLSLLGGTDLTREVLEGDIPELSYQDRDQRGCLVVCKVLETEFCAHALRETPLLSSHQRSISTWLEPSVFSASSSSPSQCEESHWKLTIFTSQ